MNRLFDTMVIMAALWALLLFHPPHNNKRLDSAMEKAPVPQKALTEKPASREQQSDTQRMEDHK